MNARAQKPKNDDASPPAAQTAPMIPAYGSHDQSFTLQAIMELQSSFAEVRSELKNLRASTDGIKSKVEDLVNWKHKIIGGAIVFGVVCTLLGFVVSKAGDYITFKPPSSSSAVVK